MFMVSTAIMNHELYTIKPITKFICSVFWVLLQLNLMVFPDNNPPVEHISYQFRPFVTNKNPLVAIKSIRFSVMPSVVFFSRVMQCCISQGWFIQI